LSKNISCLISAIETELTNAIKDNNTLFKKKIIKLGQNRRSLRTFERALVSSTKEIFGGLSPVTNKRIWATLKPDKPALCFFNFVAGLNGRRGKASPDGVIHNSRRTKIDKSSPLKSSRPRSLALGLLRGPGEKRSLKHLQAPGIYSHSLAWVVNVIKKDEGKPINCIRCFKKGLGY